MKTLHYFFLVLLFSSACKSSSDRKIGNSRNEKINVKNAILNDTTSFHNDTLDLNGERLIWTVNNSDFGNFYCLTTLTHDTIIKAEDYYSEAKILDINEDGYKDIRVFINSNTPNDCDNYFFDKKSKTFRQIENADLAIQLIKGTNYYYSYNSIGCGDDCWESHLLTITNWHAITIGHLEGRENDIEEKEIKVYKVINNKEVLIDSLPIAAIKRFKDKKFGFIDNYWTDNYKLFSN